MKKTLFVMMAAATALFAPPSTAQTAAPEPRAVADRIAQIVSDRYWSPERGAEIATTLRQRAQSGAYDRISDPRELASAFATTLRPFDNHFQVEYRPAGSAANAVAPVDPARAQRQTARGNYGFQRAEMLPGGIGYIDVRSFANFSPDSADTSPERAAADAAMAMVANAEAIIIDLRDSQGGSPAMVAYLATHFVAADADIYNTFRSRGPDRYERPFVEPRGPRRLETPLFILTSGRTASASESFAYTLQAARRATIVGSPSAGGANPGGFIDAGDGFSVFVSGATPINPITQRNWEGDGVPVDVATTSEQALDRATVLALEAIIARAASEDATLEATWALAAFNARDTHLSTRDMRPYVGAYGPRTISIEGDHLILRRDRRPALTLIPLERDLFALDGALPLQRARFERDARGRIVAMTLLLSTGQEFRDARTP